MKNILFTLITIATLVSCSNNKEEKESKKNTIIVTAPNKEIFKVSENLPNKDSIKLTPKITVMDKYRSSLDSLYMDYRKVAIWAYHEYREGRYSFDDYRHADDSAYVEFVDKSGVAREFYKIH